jgi:hypothetical protein
MIAGVARDASLLFGVLHQPKGVPVPPEFLLKL